MVQPKVFIKQHQRSEKIVLGICDEEYLGKTLKQEKFRFHVSDQFFGGELVPIESVLPLFQRCENFNAVGEKIISLLIKKNIIHAEGVITIQSVPVALKFFS